MSGNAQGWSWEGLPRSRVPSSHHPFLDRLAAEVDDAPEPPTETVHGPHLDPRPINAVAFQPRPFPPPIPAADLDEPAGPSEPQVAEYWLQVREEIADESSLRNLRLVCAVCIAEDADMRILPCGHMFCKSCILKVVTSEPHRVSRRRQPRNRSCPFCKMRLAKKSRLCLADCTNRDPPCLGMPVPKTMAELNSFPLRLTEGGGKPEACAECREIRVMRALDTLCRELLNQTERNAALAISPNERPERLENTDLENPERYKTVPELQDVCDYVMGLIRDDDFNKEYTGVTAPSSSPAYATSAVVDRGRRSGRRN